MEHPVDLILSFEELEGDDRRLAEAHLKACDECRGLLARLQKLESSSLPVDVGDGPLAGLDPAERAAAGVSREALLSSLPLGSTRGSWWRRSATGWSALALAATIGAAIWLGLPGQDELPFSGQRLAAQIVARDADVSLGDGDALTVRFLPDRSGWPVVVRVHEGQSQVMHPLVGQRPWAVTAGKPAVLPPLGAPERWSLSDGDQWYLVLAAEPMVDVSVLADELRSGDVAQILTRRFGHVAALTAP